MGTTGPASIDPATGKPYGLAFRSITIRDMVRAQAMLLDHLGIDRLFCVLGGSMGGMQVLQWAASYPERVFAALPIASAPRHSVAEHRLPRGRPPGGHGRPRLARRPLYRARASARKRASRSPAWPRTSPICRKAALHRKFGRNLQDRDAPDLRLRRRLPDRELSPPPGPDLRRPLRRQLLSLHDPGDGLFRSRRRPWRRARRRVQRHQDPLLRRLLHLDWLFPTAENRPSCTR